MKGPLALISITAFIDASTKLYDLIAYLVNQTAIRGSNFMK